MLASPTLAAPMSVAVVGASAGGVEALSALVAALPEGYGGTLCVVLHLAPGGTSVLPEILRRAGNVPTAVARDGEVMRAGHVYVAPPDRHLVLVHGLTRLSLAPRQRGHRPSIDAALRSAAHAWGPRAVGVLLSGMGDDGSAGLAAIKRHGGRVIVQDPGEAIYPAMPRSAIAAVEVDEVLELEAIAARLHALSLPGVLAPLPRRPTSDALPAPAELGTRHAVHGHEERAALLRRLADLSRERGQAGLARSYDVRADDHEHRAELLLRVLAAEAAEARAV